MGIKKQTKQCSVWVRERNSLGSLEVRSMGATAVCETRTDKGLRGNAVDLYSLVAF